MTGTRADWLFAVALIPIIVGAVHRSLVAVLAGAIFVAAGFLAMIYVTVPVALAVWLAGCALAMLVGQGDRAEREGERRHQELLRALAERSAPPEVRAAPFRVETAPRAYVADAMKPAEPPPEKSSWRQFG